MLFLKFLEYSQENNRVVSLFLIKFQAFITVARLVFYTSFF